MNRHVFWRFSFPLFIVICLALGSLGWIISDSFSQMMESILEQNLFEESHIAASQAYPLFIENDASMLQDLARNLGRMVDARVTFIRSDGVVLGDSEVDPQTMDNHINRPEVQAALAGQQLSITRISDTLHQRMLYVAVPVFSESQSILGVTRLALSLQTIEQQITGFRNLVLGVTSLVLFISLLLTSILISRLVKPLRDLSLATHEITNNPQANLPHLKRRDEIGNLARSMHAMRSTLNDRISLLQEEQNKLNGILANIADGVLILDDQSMVNLINPAILNIFGIEDELRTPLNLIEVVRNEEIVNLFQKSLSTREQQSRIMELPPGKKYIQVIITPLEKLERNEFLILVQDLTRLRRLEEIRRDFVSNVSHELRTPLASIKALVETLDQGALEDKQVAKHFLSLMDGEVDNLSQIVEELLELSRIESGKVPLSMEKSDPVSFAQNVVQRMSIQAERANLHLSFEATDTFPLVPMDSGRMEQVLINLLHNAIKFTPSGGAIQVTLTRNADSIIFNVIDNGKGIESDDLERIFERFYKTDRSRASKGTGLGLSICRHLVEAHGGKIWAESTYGQGSAFHFSLPFNQMGEDPSQTLTMP